MLLSQRCSLLALALFVLVSSNVNETSEWKPLHTNIPSTKAEDDQYDAVVKALHDRGDVFDTWADYEFTSGKIVGETKNGNAPTNERVKNMLGNMGAAIACMVPMACPAVGFLVSVFSAHGDQIAKLRADILSEVNGMIYSSIISNNMEQVAGNLLGIANGVMHYGAQKSTLINVNDQESSVFGLACVRNDGNAYIQCSDWQEAGSIYAELTYSSLYLSLIGEVARTHRLAGRNTRADQKLATYEAKAKLYSNRMTRSFKTFKDTRTGKVLKGKIATAGRRPTYATLLEPYVDTWGGRTQKICEDARQKLECVFPYNDIRECKKMLEGEYNDCYDDYVEAIQKSINGIEKVLGKFKELQNI